MGKEGRYTQAQDVFPFRLNEAWAGAGETIQKLQNICIAFSNTWPLLKDKRWLYLFGVENPYLCPLTDCGDDEGKMVTLGRNRKVTDGMHAGPSGGLVLKHANLLPSGPHWAPKPEYHPSYATGLNQLRPPLWRINRNIFIWGDHPLGSGFGDWPPISHSFCGRLGLEVEEGGDLLSCFAQSVSVGPWQK